MTTPSGPRSPHFRDPTITLKHTTLSRTPLDGWTARRWDRYLTTHNTHNRQTSMSPVGFEPAIPASVRPQIHALECAATEINLQRTTSPMLHVAKHIINYTRYEIYYNVLPSVCYPFVKKGFIDLHTGCMNLMLLQTIRLHIL